MPKRTPSNERNRIRQLREAAGLRQDELAAKAGIGTSTLARYEAAAFMGRIPAKTQESIAQALGKSVETIFPTPPDTTSRRQFLGNMGATALRSRACH